LLTDRGSEFTNPAKIEGGSTKVFYCDPQQPQQKGALEQEHSLIRQIIPKGMSFDHLQQEDIAKMNSHITSYARPGLGDKTPQEVFSFLFGQDLLQCFGLERVKPEDVILNNTLLQGFTGPTLGSNTKNFPK
jgi:IS30 family transposase